MAAEDCNEIIFFSPRMLHRMSVRDKIKTFLQTLNHAGCLISALNINIKGSEDTMNWLGQFDNVNTYQESRFVGL